MEENNLQDLKVACELLMVNDQMSKDCAILHHILKRLTNLHARALGYRDWVDAYHNIT